MTDNNIKDLDQNLQTIAEQFLMLCNSQFNTKIIVTWRSSEDQNECKSEGLSNAAAGQSPHNCVDSFGNPSSRAFDFAIFDENGAYITDGTDPKYSAAGQIGKSLGLNWGGDWEHADYDHLEMADWQNL